MGWDVHLSEPGDVHIPSMALCGVASALILFPYIGDRQTASGRVNVEWSWLQDDERVRAVERLLTGPGTAAFAMGLVSVAGLGSLSRCELLGSCPCL